ncbi:hypothetical protein DXV75_05480 [Alteromonas aestuariivivens]|uniref:Molecular chaperone DnaJ n=1 Tax=Alteromonas aestuariivivens TaxID=1938339 RepID=A0A3D8MB13_9ALTE|nr:energy-coupling factor ABC transporter permease [Alteromonas aestuariivivens]RDV27480.1 hypothetical protein DXV75_05480 [Alteromonas aestuariivivens]
MTTLQSLAVIVFISVLILLARRLQWSGFIQDRTQQHLVFGSTAALFFLWIFRVGIFSGLDVHFLWLTALTLTLGFHWAALAGSAALLGVTLVGKETWEMLGINGLLGVLAPVSVTYLIYMLSFHKLPRNFFVYVFVCAFFPGAAMIAMKMTLLGSYYTLDGLYDWDTVVDNYLLLIPLLLFPEGLLNGMTMTLLIVYRPHWVCTFHDKFYLDKP